MSDDPAAPTLTPAADGRPSRGSRTASSSGSRSTGSGLSSIFAGLSFIMAGRLEFTGPGRTRPTPDERCSSSRSAASSSRSSSSRRSARSRDYTISRWGRRKPYIFIGSILDLVFLVGIASSNSLLAIAAFIALLQFSSNFAQGPFQGYVPDLVPAPQVGTASALVGLMQVLGVVSGYVIGGARGRDPRLRARADRARRPRVRRRCCRSSSGSAKGPSPKSREGRPWRSIAAEAWGTDILKERSFLWLVASRLAILMGGACPDPARVVLPRAGDGPRRAGRRARPDPAGRARRRSGPSRRSSPPRGSRTGSGASPSSGRAAPSAPSGSAIVAARARSCRSRSSAPCCTASRPGRSSRSTGRS